MISWFAFFRGGDALDAATLDGVASLVRAVPGLEQGLVLSPPERETPHAFPGDERAPPLVLQLNFFTIEALETAIAVNGPLHDLADQPAHHWTRDRIVTQQAMLRRRFPVPDAAVRAEAGKFPCSYLVHYPGPASDINAWLGHYNQHHPPLMAKFPGVRLIEIYTRIDWVSGLGWPRENAMQRNKLLFDSPTALSSALRSPALADMRADFHRFPPFEGGNVHYALETRAVEAA